MDIRYKLKNFTYFLVKVRMAARESAVEFWKLYASDCLQIRSIKEVYLKYTDYCKQTERPALNEYIFREYIRKPTHGKLRYKNSV